jgi:hypothetical protein
LANARAKRDEAKKDISGGIDPNEARKEEKLKRDVLAKNTFQEIALEWHTSKVKKWTEGYATDILEAFHNDVFPYLGKKAHC